MTLLEVSQLPPTAPERDQTPLNGTWPVNPPGSSSTNHIRKSPVFPQKCPNPPDLTPGSLCLDALVQAHPPSPAYAGLSSKVTPVILTLHPCQNVVYFSVSAPPSQDVPTENEGRNYTSTSTHPPWFPPGTYVVEAEALQVVD